MPTVAVQQLGDRRQAVRRAGRVGDDVVALRVVDVVEVDAERDGHVGILGGRRDDHLARAGCEVLARALARAEAAGRLDHHIDVVLRPRQGRGIRLREDGDLVAGNAQTRAGGSTSPGKRPKTESRRSRCPRTFASARSLIATTSRSASRSTAARSMQRPVRPKPLIATRTGIAFPFDRVVRSSRMRMRSRIGAFPQPVAVIYRALFAHGLRGVAPDRRVLARRELPVRRPDLPAGEPAPARAAPARARQAAPTRPLGHHTRPEPALRPHEPRDPPTGHRRDLCDRARPRGSRAGRERVPRGDVLRGLRPHRRGRGGDAATVPPVLLPRRDPIARRAGDARVDPRGGRTRLLAPTRLWRGVRQPGSARAVRHRRRGSRNGAAGGELALEQVR